jgi:hypothetical protein
MNDRSPTNPTGEQKLTTGRNCYQSNSVENTNSVEDTAGKSQSSAGNITDTIHHTTDLLGDYLRKRRRTGDQPPNVEPTKKNQQLLRRK